MMPKIIGRQREMHVIRGWLDPPRMRDRSLLLVSGDAGMGKTRLLLEASTLARNAGHQVHWSQMIEDPAAPPYYAWTQLLRSIARSSPAKPGPRDGNRPDPFELNDLLPEIETGRDAAPPSESFDGMRDQFRLHDAISQRLIELCRNEPLVLLFDNLHLADDSSLRLLDHFCRQLLGSTVIVIAACRDSPADWPPALSRARPRLTAITGSEQLELDGLTRDETAALLHTYLATVPPAILVDEVFQQSDGNPLFITETGKLISRRYTEQELPESGYRARIPSTLRDLIAARCAGLDPGTLNLLQVAAVVGRDFDAEMVAALAGCSSESATRWLQPAMAAGVIDEISDGGLRFHHAMYREGLYDRLPVDERKELHEKAACFLERSSIDHGAGILSRIAYHYSTAARSGTRDTAIDFCRRAAREAIGNRAYDEAAALYQRALAMLRDSSAADSAIQFDVRYRLGLSLRSAGHLRPAANHLMRATLYAYRRKLWRRFAAGVLDWQDTLGSLGIGHVAAVSLHEQAIRNVGTDQSAIAKLTASLARAHHLRGNSDESERVIMHSFSLARQSGDQAALLFCLRQSQSILIDWRVADRCLPYHEEAVALADKLGEEDLALECGVMHLFPLVKLGRIADVESMLPNLEARETRLRHRHAANVLAGFRASLAILRGEWPDAIRLANQGAQQISLQGVVGLEGRLGFQMFAISKARGDLPQVGGFLRRILESGDSANLWLPGLALLHCELGQLDQARETLRRLGRVSELPQDDLLVISLVYLADACRQLRERSRMADLFDRLYPYRHTTACVPGVLILGAVSGYLATLAAALRKRKQARELFEHAIEFNRAIEAWPELARCCLDYAALLSAGGNNGDGRRARELASEASGIAQRLDLKPLRKRMDTLSLEAGLDRLTRREIDVLEKISAGASNKQIAFDLKLSHATVATHVRNILAKTGAANRTEAVRIARRMGRLAGS